MVAYNARCQVDISFNPLVDPLKPNEFGNIIAPHGIIGQAWDGDDVGVDGAQDNLGQLRQEQGNEVTTRAQAEGAIEGTAGDYLMKNAFATDYKYSRWDVVSAAPRKVDLI